MMQNTLDQNLVEELYSFIQASSISQDDKNVWIEALKNATPEVAFSILSYFQEFPDKIAWATDIFKRKIQAMKNKDSEAWNQILADEEAELARVIGE